MQQRNRGLTLIEVLIALAIVAIAMTAVIKATTQSIRSHEHLQNKTVALWVAHLVVNEARVNLLRFGSPQNTLDQTTSILGKTWYWRAEKKPTPNRNIYKIMVAVFNSEQDREDEKPILSVESYSYQAPPQLRAERPTDEE